MSAEQSGKQRFLTKLEGKLDRKLIFVNHINIKYILDWVHFFFHFK